MTNRSYRRGDEGREAFQRNRRQKIVEYERDPKLCPQCGDAIPWEKHRRNECCSRVCAGYRMNGLTYSKKTPRCCPRCGRVVKGRGTHCSYTCQRKGEWDRRKKEILAEGQISNGSPAAIRKFLFDDRGHACEICGRKTWQGSPIPLIADHVNGDPEDHRLVNLRLICPNCDAQLPTSKGRNRGNGRASRRARYRSVNEVEH